MKKRFLEFLTVLHFKQLQFLNSIKIPFNTYAYFLLLNSYSLYFKEKNIILIFR